MTVIINVLKLLQLLYSLTVSGEAGDPCIRSDHIVVWGQKIDNCCDYGYQCWNAPCKQREFQKMCCLTPPSVSYPENQRDSEVHV